MTTTIDDYKTDYLVFTARGVLDDLLTGYCFIYAGSRIMKTAAGKP